MKKNLVTGATGFVGCHIVRKLLERGEKVRILARPTSDLRNLEDLDVEKYIGDLKNPKSLIQALEGCDTLFHTAAEYSLWVRDPETIYQVNVLGTRNILEATRKVGVSKIVYTSTVGTLKYSDDGTPSDENSQSCLEDMFSHYKRSKFLAEQEAFKGGEDGLPIIIVNPSTPVGTHDIKPTPTGKMIVDFLKGKMLGYLQTGLNLIDVEDVAEGHILAAEKGRIGERYILGNKNLYLKEIFSILSSLSGIRKPLFRMPYSIALGLGYINTALANRVTHRTPTIPVDGVKMARKLMFFDSTKAVEELGLAQNSVEHALEKAVHWFRENNYV